MFLPNWQSISAVYDLLLVKAGLFEKLQLFVLHSLLPMSEQQEAFEHAPPGRVPQAAAYRLLGGCGH